MERNHSISAVPEDQRVRFRGIMPLSIRVNFSWALVGNLVYGLSQWVILMIIAKVGTAQQLGHYAYGLAVTTPIFLFFDGKLREVQATDSEKDFTFSHYLFLRCCTTTTALFFIGVAAFVLTGSRPLRFAIIAVALMKAVESFGDIMYGRMQLEERMDFVAKSKMIKGVACTGISIPVFLLTKSLTTMMFGIVAFWAIVCLLFDATIITRLFTKNESKPDLNHTYGGGFSPMKIRELWYLSIPLSIVSPMTSLRTYIPQFFLKHFQGDIVLGYYAAIVFIPQAGKRIVTPLVQASLARLSAQYQDSFDAFKKVFIKLVTITIAMGTLGILCAILFGKGLLTIFYAADYVVYYNVFIVSMVGGALAFIGAVFNAALLAIRRFWLQVPICIFSTASSGIASFFLIPDSGALGAVISLLIGTLVWTAGTGIALLILFQKRKTDPQYL